METTYKVGMYIRLSREDEDTENESESITNQRNFIIDYLKENNYTLYDEYVDDGYSGTTFDRPAFKKMLDDIENKKINMVVTKDMSRLGRDYVNFGHYIEKYFPEKNVRYIAITDDVDTFIDSIGNDMVPFKAIFNDMYSKDISKKIKASLSTKKKQGKFLGTHAPYGYIKDPNDKHQLLVDEEASIIVKRIYKMFLSGNGTPTIARVLTDEKIPKPSVHKKMKRYGNEDRYDIWDESTVMDILKNPNYTGGLYQSRRKKVNYKSKKIVNVAEKDWIIVHDTHEAIIDLETYELVQNIHDKNKKIHKNTSRNLLLQGFLKCKECGHTLGINKSSDKKRHYTVCNLYRKYSQRHLCTTHSMRYEEIETEVLNKVKKVCKEYINTGKLENILSNSNKKTKAIEDLTNRINNANKIISDSTQFIQNSYMDRLKGLITIEVYQGIAERLDKDIVTSKKIIEDLEKERRMYLNNTIDEKDSKKLVKDYLSMKKVDRNLLANIIDNIYIDENKNIEIYFKFKL